MAPPKKVLTDLGFANEWQKIPKKLADCFALQHRHTQLLLGKDIHSIQCDECGIEFTEKGIAPILPRIVLSFPEKAVETPALDPNNIATIVAAVLAALDAREKAKVAK